VLTARREGTNPVTSAWEWQWAAQSNGYYPSAVWYNGTNIASTALKAYTATKVDYVNHTGSGEANLTWDYNHFHPVDAADYLGDGGSTEGGYQDQLDGPEYFQCNRADPHEQLGYLADQYSRV
jgi:alpha-amylase